MQIMEREVCLLLCDHSGWPCFCLAKGALAPSAALTNPVGVRAVSTLCWQILKGIKVSLKLSSDVVTGNLLMVKNQETSCCLPRKMCPLCQTLKLSPQNNTFVHDVFDVMYTSICEISFFILSKLFELIYSGSLVFGKCSYPFVFVLTYDKLSDDFVVNLEFEMEVVFHSRSIDNFAL